ncbi:hypothetical protein JW752_02985 [Candidatus Peregrinibacteria bacterium]|nr:hypothetical protein [Candidatus Peregrinibacteria bacterium]
MTHRPITPEGPSINGHWDDLTTLERLNLILTHADHFLCQGLITRGELQMLMSTSESEWEYLSENHPDVLFTKINITADVRAQESRDRLKAALRAVFL